MTKTILHRPALEALVRVAIAPRRWTSQSELASDCGFTPSTLSSARSGQRGLSDEALGALTRAYAEATEASPDVFRDALLLPLHAWAPEDRNEHTQQRMRALQDAVTALTREIMTLKAIGD